MQSPSLSAHPSRARSAAMCSRGAAIGVAGIRTSALEAHPHARWQRKPNTATPGVLCPALLCVREAAMPHTSLGRRRKRTVSRPLASSNPSQGSAESPLDSHSESEAEEGIGSTALSDVSAADLNSTKELVEIAMLAAMTGLAYFMASVVKLEGYLGYFLPLPAVIASMRWGPFAGARVVLATCCLISVLLGPVRMLTYLFMHGLVASILGFTWAAGSPWIIRIALGALGRAVGLALYIGISCWTLNENLYAVILNGIFNFLDQILATAGSTLTPTPSFVAGVFGTLLLINNIVYIVLLSTLYSIMLRGMGYEVDLPERAQRVLYPRGMPPVQGPDY